MRRWPFIAVAVVVLAACVGVEHPVSDVVYGPGGHNQRATAAAFDGTNFLVVWADQRHDPQNTNSYDIYGARVSRTGSVLDVTGIPIARGPVDQREPDVTFDGTNYLVVWLEQRSGSADIHGARVSPAGAVLDPAGIEISGNAGVKGPPAVSVGQGSSLVVWTHCDPATEQCSPTPTTPPLFEVEGARVSPAGAVLDAPIGIAAGYQLDSDLAPDVAFGGGNYLVVWQLLGSSFANDVEAQRVSSTGDVVGSPIPLATTSRTEESPAVAFDGTNYLAVWSADPDASAGRVRGARITPAGVVLDSPGFDISTARGLVPDVVFDGTQYLATWDNGANGFAGPVVGRRVGTNGSLIDPAVLSIGPGVEPALAAGAGMVFAAFESGPVPLPAAIEGVRVRSGTVLDNTPIPLTNPANDQLEPAIAFDGSNHLLVWTDGRPAPDSDLYAGRVRADGTKLDGAGIGVSTAPGSQFDAAVVFSGTQYFVVWDDTRSGTNDIYGARVTPDGVVLDPGGIPIATTSSEEVAPAVAFDGRNFLVVWSPSTGSVLGARVSTGGTVLDRSALVITADTSAWRPAIAFTGASYLVAWQGGNGSSSWDIVGTRVSTHGKVLDPAGIAISSAPNAQERPAIAFDGSNSLVVWEDGRSSPRGDIYAARVTPTGNVLDPFGIPVSTAPDWQREPTVAANGGFLVVWRDDRRQGLPADASDIFGTRVGSNGAVLDASGFAITDSNDLESEPAVAIGLRNSWEVAYRRFAPERIYGADRVFHRTVTN